MRLLPAIVFFWIVWFPCSLAQKTGKDLSHQVKELQSQVADMQAENQALRKQIRSRDSLSYAGYRKQIFEAFNEAPRINFNFLNTTDKIAVTGLFTKLLQANNPTSDILGFRFNETILKAAEKHFIHELPTESERLRFGQIIAKLVGNPVISSLANTNPITSVTAAVISTVAGFSTTSVEVSKEGNKVKEVSATTHDAFNQKSLEAFRSELQPYINFYDALNLASTRYISGLETVNRRYTYLKNTVDTYRTQLFTSLSVNDTNTLIRLAYLLPDPSNPETDYAVYLKNQTILNCVQLAGKLPAVEQSVTEFHREYEQTLLTFLNEYIAALESARKLPAATLDQAKIDALILDIKSFITSEIQKSPDKTK